MEGKSLVRRDGRLEGWLDGCDDTLGSLEPKNVGLRLGSTDGSEVELGGRDGCCVGQRVSEGLNDGSSLGTLDEVGSDEGRALACTVGIEVGKSETEG